MNRAFVEAMTVTPPLRTIDPSARKDRAGQSGLWFGLFAVLVFCGECLGYAACQLTSARPPTLGAFAAAAGVAVVVAGVAAVLLNWLLLDQYRRMADELRELRKGVAASQALELQVASRAEMQRRLRHDLRGALSPALLTADRLINHEDPKVRRAAEIMVKSVDRASSLLADPSEVSLPGDP